MLSTAAIDFPTNDPAYREERPLTGPESRVAKVSDVAFPSVLQPVDDLPPATVITSPAADAVMSLTDGCLVVQGTTTDNGRVESVIVNGVGADDLEFNFHIWRVKLRNIKPGKLKLLASSKDEAGNVEQTPHELMIEVR